MICFYRFGMISVLLAAMMASEAGAAGVTVTRQGFCVMKSETGCSDVVLPDTIVDIARLPKGADGKPFLYFYSIQKADAKTTVVHVLESEEAADHVDYKIPAEDKAHAAGLESALKTMMKKLAHEGQVVVTPFQLAGGQLTGAGAPAMSEIPVTGPGAFHASVVDLKGNLIPVSQRISINVVQRSR